jgi:hypothetical protein
MSIDYAGKHVVRLSPVPPSEERIEPEHQDRFQRIAKDGRIIEVGRTATALVNETGDLYPFATMERSAQGAQS